MQKTLIGLSLAIVFAALSGAACADTLIMKDGTSHDGEFVSGTSRVITFRENGVIKRFGTEDIDSLQFGPTDQGPRSEASQSISADADGNYPSTPQAPVPQDAQSDPRDDRNVNERNDRSDAVIPSGTELAIRTSEAINSRNARVDQTFDGQVDRDLLGDAGQVLIPKGADARLVIRRLNTGGSTGTPEITLDLESIRMDGRRYLIDASDITEKGVSGIGNNKRTGEMVGSGAVLGTIVGAIAGGGKGAAIGAVSGAAAGGAAEVLTRGKEVRVPSETVLRFKLDHPVHLRPSE